MQTFESVPVIDLRENRAAVVAAIADACSSFGFFQIIGHGVDPALLERFQTACREYFDQPASIKDQWRRHAANARGYFDDELTKQRRDWKEALDVGVPGSRDWSLSDNDPSNVCLDGLNRLPTEQELSGFRATIVEYFDACACLSHTIAVLMAEGVLGESASTSDLVANLQTGHTSYLRLNYYPPYDGNQSPTPLGISPHRDAGFLTVLLQDYDCHSLQVEHDGHWLTVVPEPGALTVNTGDMAEIWSNGRYQAPLHRVLTSSTDRYSAPFFYNPPYAMEVAPVLEPPRFLPCLWGYFRAVRFAGDLTDLGVEIQKDDFLINAESKHRERQAKFAKQVNYKEPFDVEKFRGLLTS